MTIHRTVAELDAGPIAAQRAFPIAPSDDAGAVYARRPRWRRSCSTPFSPRPEPEFGPQPSEGVTYADKIGPADRELTSRTRTGAAPIRALSPTSARGRSCTGGA